MRGHDAQPEGCQASFTGQPVAPRQYQLAQRVQSCEIQVEGRQTVHLRDIGRLVFDQGLHPRTEVFRLRQSPRECEWIVHYEPRFTMMSSASPTFFSPSISPLVKRKENSFSTAIRKRTWLRLSQPSTSSAVI